MKTLFDEEEETSRWLHAGHSWGITAVGWPIQWHTESLADMAWRERERVIAAFRQAMTDVHWPALRRRNA